MNLAILFGGKSSEHEVSLVSASSVARNLDPSKYKVIPIGISKSGKWFLQSEEELARVQNDPKAAFTINEDPSKIVSVIPGGKKDAFLVEGKSLQIDAVFGVVHGTFCEDGVMQGLLEAAEVPYVGCGVMASGLTMDKEKTKVVWKDNGLPIVPYYCFTRTDINDNKRYDALVEKVIADFGFPIFVKPCNAGSSVGASKASNAREFSMALAEAFTWDNKVLVEKAVNAREIECSVTGNSLIQNSENAFSAVRSYTPGEINPTHEFYDYDAKYNDPDGAALNIPANLDEKTAQEIKALAEKAYTVLDCSGLSRVDFFIDKDTGKIYLNEINTIPGFTSISMFPKMCEAAGLGYKDLINLLIDEAVERFNESKKLLTSR
ncbi:MAG: D-alanine--D-alanine ligase [Treponema sp.]|nr:D-alanine--D-alanine ligase [Treponema sp.]